MPPICHSLSALDLDNLKKFVFSINCVTPLFTTFFSSLLVYILDSLNSNSPWKTWSKFFLVKTNHLFLPFVSSIFMGLWEEFPFYPTPALPLSVSLFLVLFGEIFWKPACTSSTGQCDHRIVCFSGQFRTCITLTYLCKAYGLLCDRLFHKFLFILWNIIVSTHFVVCNVRHRMLLNVVSSRRFSPHFTHSIPTLL